MSRRRQAREEKGPRASPFPANEAVRVSPSLAKEQAIGPLFAGVFGAFLGLCLLKFGNPPIMESFIRTPEGFLGTLATTPWPLSWTLWLGIPTVLLGIAVVVQSGVVLANAPRWLTVLPLAWVAWQGLSTAASVDRSLSLLTLFHFTAATACYYLGFFALARVRNLRAFWTGLAVAFIFVIAIGLDQHFGGLEESRRFFYQQQQLYPDRHYPPELLKKIASTRIYSTLFYPNTLAGGLLLLLPPTLVIMPHGSERLRLGAGSRWQTLLVLGGVTVACIVLYLLNSRVGWLLFVLVGFAVLLPIPRWIAPSIVGFGSLGCLYWSGSKGGWLLMLVLGLVALMRLDFGRRLKALVLAVVLVAGLSAFAVKYAGFFQRGATSVVARFDYWRAAAQTALTHPVLGTGPGTFASAYEKLKKPESEMARLVHNDYLQQASDSGIPGFLLYSTFIVGALVFAFPRKGKQVTKLRFAVWLGVLGLALQCMVEFSLYVPALAWVLFAFLGWLAAMPKAGELIPGSPRVGC
jgi:O-antigen ligase